MRHDLGIRASVAAAVVVAFGGMAAAANAATKTSDYHPDPQARNFAGGAGGWTANAVYEGTLCIPALTCPLVTNSYQPSGGADGASDGFLETKTSDLANAGDATEV